MHYWVVVFFLVEDSVPLWSHDTEELSHDTSCMCIQYEWSFLTSLFGALVVGTL